MNQTFTFGVVGGYGATGRMVVSELRESFDGEILIGGRDFARAKALAAEFGGRVSAAQVDVLNDRSLDDFCSQCSIVINCAGPVMQLQDRVAQASFRKRCHYVDPAGLTVVKERMLPHRQEIADLGLSFVVSAGWLPGLTEIVPLYANAQARNKMDTVESVRVYFGDSGDWSENALRDAVWYIHKSGIHNPWYFRKGERVTDKSSAPFRRVNLGGRVGTARFAMYPLPEQNEIGQRLNDCRFFAYSYVVSFRTIMTGALIALLPLSEKFAVRLLRNAFRKGRLPVGGFVVAQIRGQAQGRHMNLTAQMIYEKGQDYRTNAVPLATVARMIAERRSVQRGLHFLADAVDPITFVEELRKAGVEVTQSFESCQ